MPSPRNRIKVFVASTVYNFEPELQQVYNLLDGYGYDVYNSHMGTLPLDSSKSNLQTCLDAVKEVDIFLGFIRPDYGSGVIGGKESITHLEFRTAIELGIPRFVLADYRVTFTRSLLRKAQIEIDSVLQKVEIEKLSLDPKIMDPRCIQLYNEAIMSHVQPVENRTGHWVQEYKNANDIEMHLDSQFRYPDRIQKLIDNSKVAKP